MSITYPESCIIKTSRNLKVATSILNTLPNIVCYGIFMNTLNMWVRVKYIDVVVYIDNCGVRYKWGIVYAYFFYKKFNTWYIWQYFEIYVILLALSFYCIFWDPSNYVNIWMYDNLKLFWVFFCVKNTIEWFRLASFSWSKLSSLPEDVSKCYLLPCKLL